MHSAFAADQRREHRADTTILSSGSSASILAPGEVSPGHMILAPLRMNLMAPLSTCTWGRRNGSARGSGQRQVRVGEEKWVCKRQWTETDEGGGGETGLQETVDRGR